MILNVNPEHLKITVKYDDDYVDVDEINDYVYNFTSKGKSGYVYIKVTTPLNDNSKYKIITIGQLIENGTYHIQNAATGMYMDLETKSSGVVNIEQDVYAADELAQRWRITYVSNGFYKIQSYYSFRYLSVDTSGNIVQTSTYDDSSKWRIDISEKGNLVFVSNSSIINGAPKTFAVSKSTSTSGENLIEVSYSLNNLKNDEWLIEPIGLRRSVSLIGVSDSNPRGELFGNVLANLSSIGYNSNNYAKVGCIGDDYMINLMKNSKITLIRTHGHPNAIENTTRYVEANDFESGDLSYSDLIVYGACLTGESNSSGTNLVIETQAKGARTVIGFMQETNAFLGEVWYDLFFKKYTDAIESGDTSVTYSSICDEVAEEMEKGFTVGDDNNNYIYIKDYIDYSDLASNSITLDRIKVFNNYTIAGENMLPFNN